MRPPPAEAILWLAAVLLLVLVAAMLGGAPIALMPLGMWP